MTHWLNRRLIELPYYYRLCITEKDFKRELKRLNIKYDVDFLSSSHADATCHFMYEAKGKKQIVIVCLGDTDGRSITEIYGLLIHEATHIWQGACDHIGEKNLGIDMEGYAIHTIAPELILTYNRQARKHMCTQ